MQEGNIDGAEAAEGAALADSLGLQGVVHPRGLQVGLQPLGLEVRGAGDEGAAGGGGAGAVGAGDAAHVALRVDGDVGEGEEHVPAWVTWRLQPIGGQGRLSELGKHARASEGRLEKRRAASQQAFAASCSCPHSSKVRGAKKQPPHHAEESLSLPRSPLLALQRTQHRQNVSGNSCCSSGSASGSKLLAAA